MERLGIGMVGAGFASRLHVDAWKRVPGIDVSIVATVTTTTGRFEDVLTDPRVDVIDLCVPNHLHAPYAHAALEAGKHVVVEKPLTGAFVRRDEMTPAEMLEHSVRAADELVAAATAAGRYCFYAENWVYAPPITKARGLLAEAGGTILRIQGEESHSGTHSEPNKHWITAGGGALFGKGCHPLGAALQLKGARPRSVIAHTASLTKIGEQTHLRTGYEDVEDWGLLVCEFDDGSVAEIVGGDTTLGGVRNQLRVYASNVVVEANLNPNNAVRAYAPDADVLAGAYLSEKLETHGGWSSPSPDEDWMQGYPQEIQDFAECAVTGRAPLADAKLGRDVLVVIYGAYLSAAEGRRVDLTPYFG